MALLYGAARRPLPYIGQLDRRSPSDIDLLVVHCTELPDLETARTFGERTCYAQTGTGNSGHFYVDRDGHTECWVTPDRVAHHVRGHNHNSIGIELVNLGRYPDWLDSRHQLMQEPYPADQVEALVRLLRTLLADFSGILYIAGHEELDRSRVPASDDPALMVSRKCDPGPLFPWPAVLKATGLQRLPGH